LTWTAEKETRLVIRYLASMLKLWYYYFHVGTTNPSTSKCRQALGWRIHMIQLMEITRRTRGIGMA
jgi:hypothetical protein